MADVRIMLTFDDGPHAAAGSSNYTRQVITALDTAGIVGAFFIQTGVSYRMGNDKGEGVKVVQEAAGTARALKHVIAIHTGGPKDHRPHWEKPDELENELAVAKQRVARFTPQSAEFVRAVGLELANPTWAKAQRDRVAAQIRQVYGRQSLKHVGINVNSYDNTRKCWAAGSRTKRNPTAAEVNAALSDGVDHALRRGFRDLIVLFHDINRVTATNISAYITTLRNEVNSQGHTAIFTDSYSSAVTVLRAAIETNESQPLPPEVEKRCK